MLVTQSYMDIFEAALQINGVTESDMKEVIKKQFENAPKRDEKMMEKHK